MTSLVHMSHVFMATSATTTDTARQVASGPSQIPHTAQGLPRSKSIVNMIGSHDTNRFRTPGIALLAPDVARAKRNKNVWILTWGYLIITGVIICVVFECFANLYR